MTKAERSNLNDMTVAQLRHLSTMRLDVDCGCERPCHCQPPHLECPDGTRLYPHMAEETLRDIAKALVAYGYK